MLRLIPGWKLKEWQIFYELEPDEGERNDWGLAHVVQALSRPGIPLRDFMLSFGDDPGHKPQPQTLEYQEMIITGWCFANNEMLAKKGISG